MSDRRGFIKSATGGILILKPDTVFGSQANSLVEIGLIGCGGRGNWIGPFFPEYTGARMVALAEVQKEALESTRTKFNVDSSRAYYGPDAYKELAQSKVDAVVIETPPYFHPDHAAYAVDQGKHVYVAKPVAVDVPGCKSILASGKKAQEKKLTFWVDFQSRAQPVFQELVQRIRDGAIGKPVLAQTFYYAGRPAEDKSPPGTDPGLRRMRMQSMDKVLGGDIIVEQNIHVIDMTNWYLNGHPLKANGTGGRTDWRGTKYDAADGFDHFALTFWYPNDVSCSFSSNQLTRHFSDLCVRLFGIQGAVDSHYGGLVRITGENAWTGAEKDDTFRQGAVNNVKAFIASVREGKAINNAEVSVESNLTAILGRMAAYGNKTVTWDEMMRSNERLEANLKLRW